MRLKSANSVKLAAFVAALTALSLGQSPAVHAGSLSFVPSDSNIMFRRYRGEDEVADHDDGRGRGRGRGGQGSESNNSGGQSDHSNSRAGDSPGSNGNSKNGGPDRDDLDDRFGK